MRLHDDIKALRAEVRMLQETVNRLVRHVVPAPVLPSVDAKVDRLVIAAATEFRVRPEEILSPRKTLLIARARQWVMFEAHALGLSTPQIGAALRRDHTTVWHGVEAERARRKALSDNEESAIIEAGRALRQQPPDPDRNRDLMGGAQHG